MTSLFKGLFTRLRLVKCSVEEWLIGVKLGWRCGVLEVFGVDPSVARRRVGSEPGALADQTIQYLEIAHAVVMAMASANTNIEGISRDFRQFRV